MRLLDALPAHLRLLHLRREFPHVLNRLAEAWDDPPEFEMRMRALTVDSRGDRQGFPPLVQMEVADLLRHHRRQANRCVVAARQVAIPPTAR